MTVDRDDFLLSYDFGVADRHGPVDSPVMILYTGSSALPSHPIIKEAAMFYDGSGIPTASSAAEATENCELMNVVVTNGRTPNQCLAIVDGYESFHLQRWMKVDANGRLDKAQKNLSHVGRGLMAKNGRDQFESPFEQYRKKGMDMVGAYLNSFDRILRDLGPIAKSVARDRTITVMLCNMGQSELLINFACNAKARDLDLSNILVFATDEGTEAIATGLGLTSFYDEEVCSYLQR